MCTSRSTKALAGVKLQHDRNTNLISFFHCDLAATMRPPHVKLNTMIGNGFIFGMSKRRPRLSSVPQIFPWSGFATTEIPTDLLISLWISSHLMRRQHVNQTRNLDWNLLPHVNLNTTIGNGFIFGMSKRRPRLLQVPQIFPNRTHRRLYEVSKVAETVCKTTRWTICEYSWVQWSYLASKDTLLTFSRPHCNPLPFLKK